MSIKKRNGKYDVSVTRTVKGQRYRFDRTFNTYKEAQKEERAFHHNCDEGKKPNKNVLFVIYGQNYIDNLDGISARTKQSYQQKFNYLKDYFVGHITDYNNSDIKRNLVRIKADHDLSNQSMQHIFKILKRIFRQASLDELIQSDPSGTFKVTTSYKVTKKKSKALSSEDQSRFMKYLSDRQDSKFFAKQEYIFGLIAISTGLRRGELCALDWKYIDLDKQTLSVEQSVTYANRIESIGSPKTVAGIRTLQMDKFLVAELRKYQSYLRETLFTDNMYKDGWVFPYLDGVKRTPITSWSQRMEKVFKLLDIKASLHSLRHTHASNMLMNDFPVVQLSHRLGHADPSITLSIYAHEVKGMELDINNFIPNLGLKQVN